MPTDRGPVGNSRVNDWFYRAPETVEEPPGLPNEIKPLPPIIHAWKIDLPRLIKCDRKFIDFRSIPEAITDNQSDVLESFGVSLGMFVPPREPTRPPRPPRPPPSPPRRNFPAREGRCSAEPFVPAPVAARPWSDSTVIYERVVWIRPEVPSRLELSDAQRIPTPPQKSLETPKFSRFQTIRDGFRNMLADWFSVYGAQRDSDPEVAGFKDQGSQTIPKQSSPRRQLPLLPQPEESTKQKRKLPLRPDGLGYLVQEPSGPGTSGLYPRLAWSVRGPGPDPGSLGVPPTSRPEGYLDPRFRPEPSRYMIPHAYFVPQVYCAHLVGPLNARLPQYVCWEQRKNIRHEDPCPQRRRLPLLPLYSEAQSVSPSEYSDNPQVESRSPRYFLPESLYTQFYSPSTSSGGYWEDPGPGWTPSSRYSDHHPRHNRSSSVGYGDYRSGGVTPESQQLPSEYESSAPLYYQSEQSPAPSYYQSEQSQSTWSPVPAPQGPRRGLLERQENVDVPTTSSDLSAPASEIGRDSQGRHPRDSASPWSQSTSDYWPGRRH